MLTGAWLTSEDECADCEYYRRKPYEKEFGYRYIVLSSTAETFYNIEPVALYDVN